MKPHIIFRLCLATFFLVPSGAAWAHQPLAPLKPGQVDLSLDWQFISNINIFLVTGFEDTTGQIVEDIGMCIDAEPNGKYARLNSVVELGILPGWSLGLNTDFPGGLIDLINGGKFGWCLGLYSTLHLAQAGPYRLYVHGMAEAFPLIGSYDNPLLRCYLLASSGLTVLRFPQGELSVYGDLKASTSPINPLFATPDSVMRSLNRHNSLAPNAVLEWHNAYRVGTAIGLDLRIGRILLNLGWNIPLLDFSFEDGVLPTTLREDTLSSLVNLEFSARVRL
jgi:hypothetical protein